jgi:hypothetical protein
MKHKIELIYDDQNNEEIRKEIGYLRLLIYILGGSCHISVRKPLKTKKKHFKKKFVVGGI